MANFFSSLLERTKANANFFADLLPNAGAKLKEAIPEDSVGSVIARMAKEGASQFKGFIESTVAEAPLGQFLAGTNKKAESEVKSALYKAKAQGRLPAELKPDYRRFREQDIAQAESAAAGFLGGLKQVGKKIIPELQPLAQEARKYKSAEEFVSSLGTRGKSLKMDDVVPDEVLSIIDKRISDLTGIGLPEKFYKGFDGIKLSRLVEGIEKLGIEDDVFRESTIVLRKRGYTRIGDILLTEDGMKTKSQLTDIWERVQGEAKKTASQGSQALKKLETPQVSQKTSPSTKDARLARMGQEGSFAGTVPPEPPKVKPPVARGGIKPPELNFENWKDKSALSLSRETLERNLDRVAGADAPKLQEFIVRPTRQNETARITFNNALRKEVKDTVVEKLGIRGGSKEDALVQRFGEKNITLDELKEETLRWKEVEEASNFFRKKYDDLLDRVNATRAKFGYNPIPKREDYFRHFQELDNIIQQFGVILREQDLPTEISGLTEFFKPGKPFSTAELRRLGGRYTESAIRGMDNYIDSISRQIFHIDSVQRARSLEKYIRQAGKAGEVKLPNFVANIKEYGNLVAGKKATFDRAFEGLFGRRFYVVMNALRSRTSANMIGGNISSALTNFIPFTQALSTTSKPSLLRGTLESLTSPFKKSFADIGGVQSSFLIRRYPEKYIDPTKMQKAGEFANWFFETIDKFTAKAVVSGKFYELLGRGVAKEEAIKLADDYAGRILADRSIGQLPNLMGVRATGVLTQFQTEINNAYSVLVRDMPKFAGGNKGKIASSVAQFFIYSYLFNSAFEQVTGRRPTIDPIQFLFTLTGVEEGSIGKETEELVGNLPFVGGITGGRLPIGAGIPNVPALLKGQTTLGKELKKPLFFVAPPFGGLQIKKTLEGVSAFGRGKVKSASGKTTLFKVKQTLGNLGRGALFGKYAFPEARRYFDKKK